MKGSFLTLVFINESFESCQDGQLQFTRAKLDSLAYMWRQPGMHFPW